MPVPSPRSTIGARAPTTPRRSGASRRTRRGAAATRTARRRPRRRVGARDQDRGPFRRCDPTRPTDERRRQQAPHASTEHRRHGIRARHHPRRPHDAPDPERGERLEPQSHHQAHPADARSTTSTSPHAGRRGPRRRGSRAGRHRPPPPRAGPAPTTSGPRPRRRAGDGATAASPSIASAARPPIAAATDSAPAAARTPGTSCSRGHPASASARGSAEPGAHVHPAEVERDRDRPTRDSRSTAAATVPPPRSSAATCSSAAGQADREPPLARASVRAGAPTGPATTTATAAGTAITGATAAKQQPRAHDADPPVLDRGLRLERDVGVEQRACERGAQPAGDAPAPSADRAPGPGPPRPPGDPRRSTPRTRAARRPRARGSAREPPALGRSARPDDGRAARGRSTATSRSPTPDEQRARTAGGTRVDLGDGLDPACTFGTTRHEHDRVDARDDLRAHRGERQPGVGEQRRGSRAGPSASRGAVGVDRRHASRRARC